MPQDALMKATGPLRRDYEAVDWAATPVGAIATWSPALRNAVDLALHTRFPVTLFWGPEFVLIYNAAYVPLIADKHPAALGTPARDVFPEAWDAIGPMMNSVLAGDGATWVEDAAVPLHRRGVLEEAYFTFSYSPVRGAHGAIEGVMDIAWETTQRVIDRRRLQLLNRLQELLGGLERVDDVIERSVPLLRAYADDFPAVDVEVATASADGDIRVQETSAGRVAHVPIESAADGGAVLRVRLSERLANDGRYLGFLRLTASLIGQALDRITAREAERGMSEALQRSLLDAPLQPDHLEVAVRYRPAAETAQVGGDWFDAFMVPDGALTLVVGDVTGHDRQAAAGMAQVRNLLRGVSYSTGESPARVLTVLDEAMHGLHVGAFATAVVARVEQDPEMAERDVRTLRWSNAGHPPPVLVRADGHARLLETPPEVLLGIGGGRRRADHAETLEAGTTVVFYTDGLVERRRVPLQERFDWLIRMLSGCAQLDPEAICDHLLAGLEDPVEDDVALLVLRAR